MLWFPEYIKSQSNSSEILPPDYVYKESVYVSLASLPGNILSIFLTDYVGPKPILCKLSALTIWVWVAMPCLTYLICHSNRVKSRYICSRIYLWNLLLLRCHGYHVSLSWLSRVVVMVITYLLCQVSVRCCLQVQCFFCTSSTHLTKLFCSRVSLTLWLPLFSTWWMCLFLASIQLSPGLLQCLIFFLLKMLSFMKNMQRTIFIFRLLLA